jgi:cell wall-associated NlpC family hydrolase
MCAVLVAAVVAGNASEICMAAETDSAGELAVEAVNGADGESRVENAANGGDYAGETVNGEDCMESAADGGDYAGETADGEVCTEDVNDGDVTEADGAGSEEDVVSSGSLMVTSLGMKATTVEYKTSVSSIKLNFSYNILGCVKVSSSLNVRKERSTGAEIAGTLTNNTFCNVLEVYEDGWAKIESGKISGYVSTEYLLMGEKAENAALKKAKKYVKVTGTSVLNIRALPTVNSSTYGQAKKNKKVTLKYESLTAKKIKKLLKKNKSLRRQLSTSEKKSMLQSDNLNNWVCVKYNGKTAFVSKDFVKVKYVVKTGSTQSSSKSALRKKLVKYAKKFLGNKYVYGGTSLTKGTDCSGFIMRIYQHFGYRLSRTSSEQSKNGTKTSRSKLQPGDLLFYKKNGKISHVTMYIGNGKVIHASNEKNGIMISKISYRKACKYVKIIKT